MYMEMQSVDTRLHEEILQCIRSCSFYAVSLLYFCLESDQDEDCVGKI